VGRCSWRVYVYVIMSNHFHLIVKTPEPNLARGMQALLSSYANAWARRHRFPGHLFQGRYRTELVEDETYLWTVTAARVGSPQGIAPPRLPQIRTCPLRHTARHVMKSLRAGTRSGRLG
jgi:hypothetical protein